MAVYGLRRSAGAVFGPQRLCEPAREGLTFLSVHPSFFRLFLLTMYLGSLAATQSSQGVPRFRGFWSLAARGAASGAVYGVQREEGLVFGPWLLCEAASGVYDLPRSRAWY